MERLDKFLCDAGVGSRSQVKQILKAGRVTVKGTVIRDGSVKIDGTDVFLDGEAVGKKGLAVVMLNKPAGYVTARTDETQKTVMELLPKEMLAWDLHPIGRLDKETEGLLLFTNDGDLLHRLISPGRRYSCVFGRAYFAGRYAVSFCCVAAFRRGRELDHGLRRQISSGSANDGIPRSARNISGASGGRRAYFGRSAPRSSQGTFAGRNIGIMTIKIAYFPEAETSASGILTKKGGIFAIKCQNSLAICAK